MIRRLRRSAAFLALVALAACAKPTAQQAATPSPSPSSGGAVGYVNMQELVKAHPLYSQLAQTERSIGALSLSSLGPGVAQTGANLSKEDAELQKELTQASEETI
jgi:Skp family chaperone for outer membrane proteins